MTNGWINYSEQKPTQKQIEDGVWWVKRGSKNLFWKRIDRIDSAECLNMKESDWFWRPDPPAPPMPMSDAEVAFDKWFTEEKMNDGTTHKNAFLAGWKAHVDFTF